MTVKKYYEDSYTAVFTANVLKTFPVNNLVGLIFDQTYFYPGGGGQPADQGYVNNFGLLDIFEDQDGNIVHVVAQEVFGEVQCKIDWSTRFDHIQQHTAQHILSQGVLQVLEAPTLGWSLGRTESYITIKEIDISLEMVSKIENLINQIVFENREIFAYFAQDLELESLPLRKNPNQKFSNEQGYRIINIGDFDYIPCGGTHCKRTGEVGVILIKDWRKNKGQTTITFVAGNRSIKNNYHQREIIQNLCGAFNIGEHEIIGRVQNIVGNLASKDNLLQTVNKYLVNLETELLLNSIKGNSSGERIVVAKQFPTFDTKQLKYVSNNIVKNYTNIFVILGNEDSIVINTTKDSQIDIKDVLNQIVSKFGGKSGGNNYFGQATGFRPSDLAQIIDFIRSLI